MAENKCWIEVVCAIKESNNKFLCVQRSLKMRLPLKWEFPGGKLKSNETEKNAIKREIKEELKIDIIIKKRLNPNYHIYPNGACIKLIPFYCQKLNGEIELLEHSDYKWLDLKSLNFLDWAEADIPIIKQIELLKL